MSATDTTDLAVQVSSGKLKSIYVRGDSGKIQLLRYVLFTLFKNVHGYSSSDDLTHRYVVLNFPADLGETREKVRQILNASQHELQLSDKPFTS